VSTYRAWTKDFDFDTGKIAAARATLARAIPYTHDAPSPWCNTIVLYRNEFDWRVTAIPPGYGVSDAYPLPAHMKSRYALLGRNATNAGPFIAANHLRRVVVTAAGTVYANPRRQCGRRSNA
jgi:hypothetical protein